MRTVFTILLAAAAAVCAQSELLLSEICIRPSAAEFIEIYNPNGTAVPLDVYYLTDLYGDQTRLEQFYPYMVHDAVSPQLNTDFLVTFPSGASIPAGGVIVVAMDGSGFLGAYGSAPDFCITGSGIGESMAVPANGFVGSNAGLTNGAETVMLFHWNGTSDLVEDADYVQWGVDGTRRVYKTGISLDGPDGDSSPSDYLPDTEPGDQDTVSPGAHDAGDSYQRVDFGEGAEIKSGGNGISGHDETSEDLSVTWTTGPAAPGEVETALERSTWADIKTAF